MMPALYTLDVRMYLEERKEGGGGGMNQLTNTNTDDRVSHVNKHLSPFLLPPCGRARHLSLH